MWKLDGKSDGEGSLESVQISRSLNFEVDFKRIVGIVILRWTPCD